MSENMEGQQGTSEGSSAGSSLGDPQGDPHSVSQQWKRWKQSFQLYLAGNGVTSAGQKWGLLLHTAGFGRTGNIFYAF